MLVGQVDEASGDRIRGWCRNPAFPDVPVSLLISANGRLLERVVANRYRPDVEQAGFGHGKFGFDVMFNPPLRPSRSWLLRVRSEIDGEDILGSPVRVLASTEFNEAARVAFAASVGSVATDSELDDRIEFLAAQQERLLQMRADRRSSKTARDAERGRQTPSSTAPPRALVIDDKGIPDPDRDGGSSALVAHMHSLRRLGFDVTFAAPQMVHNPAAAALERHGFTVCHAPWLNSVEEVLRREGDSYDVVYVHRVSTALAYITLVRRYQPRTRLIYSVADLHHLRLARQAEFEDRPELLAEAGRVGAQELWAAKMADAVITHSHVEASLLRQVIPAERVHTVSWSVPCRPRTVTFTRRKGVAFIGNFLHEPNVAAAWRLRTEIMPSVHSTDPSINCRLVGRNPPIDLQTPEPGFEAIGTIANLDDLFDAVRLTVAPLRFGAGLKSKVIASLAAGVPCVCSTIAAEGLALPGELRSLVIDDDAAAVKAILQLHNDEALNTRLGALGIAFAAAEFSESVLDRAMQIAIADITTA